MQRDYSLVRLIRSAIPTTPMRKISNGARMTNGQEKHISISSSTRSQQPTSLIWLCMVRASEEDRSTVCLSVTFVPSELLHEHRSVTRRCIYEPSAPAAAGTPICRHMRDYNETRLTRTGAKRILPLKTRLLGSVGKCSECLGLSSSVPSHAECCERISYSTNRETK